ncbi:Ribosome-binding protein 1, putative [Babesia ovata]|uniref:Ribosome-binding protein 1, putative n=1 Tax=Babesia ovata TaxID=189622 RepID=A0A2H6KDU4_9APIC|nr:Ribosome-binding protein 1, putative [Babesia ovata]GBE61157.1 Ribosome-binding protein 1, putative [Babesia ovata]
MAATSTDKKQTPETVRDILIWVYGLKEEPHKTKLVQEIDAICAKYKIQTQTKRWEQFVDELAVQCSEILRTIQGNPYGYGYNCKYDISKFEYPTAVDEDFFPWFNHYLKSLNDRMTFLRQKCGENGEWRDQTFTVDGNRGEQTDLYKFMLDLDPECKTVTCTAARKCPNCPVKMGFNEGCLKATGKTGKDLLKELDQLLTEGSPLSVMLALDDAKQGKGLAKLLLRMSMAGIAGGSVAYLATTGAAAPALATMADGLASFVNTVLLPFL